jgi:hypothetical protein
VIFTAALVNIAPNLMALRLVAVRQCFADVCLSVKDGGSALDTHLRADRLAT